MLEEGLIESQEADLADDFKAAVGEATAAVRDLEAALRAESCHIQAGISVEDVIAGGELDLIWKQVGPTKLWRVVAVCQGRERALLELPAPCRLAAYKHLPALGDAARAAMREAIRQAGLGGEDR